LRPDRLKRREFIKLVGGAVLTWPAAARSAPAELPTPVAYQTMANASVQLRPFVGRNMALLIDPARQIDRAVIDRCLAAFDRAWDWYRDYFGRSPAAHRSYSAKTTVAEVASPRVVDGSAGIELASSTVDLLLQEAVRDRYNQATFFIMGRNFWSYDNPLGPINAFRHGFAHVHRFYSIDGADVTGAPWDDKLDFDHYRHSIVIDMLNRYLADPNLTWQNTLAVDKAPQNPNGWGAGELAAGFFHRIRRDHGQDGCRRFWRMMQDAPKAQTPKESASRFVQIARAATGEDYRSLFRDMTLQIVY
jgi:serralysin